MARRFGVSFLVVLLCGAPAAADPPLEPRPQLVKPVQIEFNDRFLPNVITVKFRDGLTARLQDGILTDLVTGDLAEAQVVLATVAAGTWRRTYSLPEAQLTALRETARQNLGRVVADPNLRFNLFLPPGTDAGDVIDAFNALDCVELALPIPKPVPLPVPPDFQPNQVYQNGGPSGVSAEAVWNDGITGTTIKVADIEYSWNLDHLDLPPVTILGFPPVDPFNDNNHGAAVLGEVAAISNGWGVTGIAHGAEFFVVGTWNGAIWDVGSAIITSLGQLGPGDVIIIEQQIDGPTGPTDFVPIEWWPPWYDAIVIAVGNAVIVVEAAGNGGQNLDDAIFSTGNFGHWPFLPENDSGAIIVGAGAAPSGFGSDVDRSRLWFSTAPPWICRGGARAYGPPVTEMRLRRRA